MMKTFVVLLCLLIAAQAIQLPGPYVHKPGIIIPTINSLNETHLNIPRGGAIIRPVAPINNTDEVATSFIIDGQACDIGDPLTFYYGVLDTEGSNILLTFPTDLFNLVLCCGVDDTIIIVNSGSSQWNLKFTC